MCPNYLYSRKMQSLRGVRGVNSNKNYVLKVRSCIDKARIASSKVTVCFAKNIITNSFLPKLINRKRLRKDKTELIYNRMG